MQWRRPCRIAAAPVARGTRVTRGSSCGRSPRWLRERRGQPEGLRSLLVKRWTGITLRPFSRGCFESRHSIQRHRRNLSRGELLMALGDRRSRVRLEVVGALWATLELAEPARLVDLSQNGALITSTVPMPPESVQPLQLKVEGREVTVDARVRHIRLMSGPDQPARYLVGVEFLSIPATLAQATVWPQA